MAGTAAGAAKARSYNPASLANLRQNKPASSVEVNPDSWATASDRTDLIPASGQVSGNQTLAAKVVSDGSLPAAAYLVRTVQNVRVSTSLRIQAACKIMEFAGFGQQSAQQSAADDSQAAVIAKLAAALGRPMPRQPVTIDQALDAVHRDKPVTGA